MNLSSLFWKIFIAVTMFVSGVAFISLNVKKVLEKFKEFRIKQKITVMPIENQFHNIPLSSNSGKIVLICLDMCIKLLTSILGMYKNIHLHVDKIMTNIYKT